GGCSTPSLRIKTQAPQAYRRCDAVLSPEMPRILPAIDWTKVSRFDFVTAEPPTRSHRRPFTSGAANWGRIEVRFPRRRFLQVAAGAAAGPLMSRFARA